MPVTTRSEAASRESREMKQPATKKLRPTPKKQRPAPKGKKSAPKPKPTNTEEAEKSDNENESGEDPGRHNSKQFFQEAKKGKPVATVCAAKEEIEADLKRTIEYIKNQKQKMGPTVNIGESLRQHLSQETRPSTTIHDPNSSGEPHQAAVFDEANKLLAQLRASTKLYETILSRPTGLNRPHLQWEEDAKNLKDLNKYAMTNTIHLINNHIIPDSKSVESPPPEKAGHAEKVAWEMFDGVRQMNTDQTWGHLAQKQVKAFTGVLEVTKD